MSDLFSAKIISLQFALFFRDVVDRPDIEFSDVNANMMNMFDAIPTVMPIPRELPPDVPMVTQRSESNEYICNVARSRIDLHFQRVTDRRSNAELLTDFNAKVLGFISYVLKKRPIVRFGMICRYFHETPSAVGDIRQKYFAKTIGDVEELSLRFNRKTKFIDWDINDIVEINAAAEVTDQGTKNGIFVQRDINNVPRGDMVLDEKSLHQISRKYAALLTEQSIEVLLK